MSSRPRPPVPPLARSLALLCAVGVLAGACSTAGGPRTPAKVVREPGGFSITEEVDVPAGAREDFERALRLLDAGRNREAIELLTAVTEAAPGATAAHIDLSIAYVRVDDLERARVSLERARELNPLHPVAHNELGIVYRRLGRFDDARRSYERVLSAHPEFHFARRNLAVLCDVYLGDLECALEHYERYIEAVPDDEAASVWIADLRSRVGGDEP